ncbi:hypothetical protein [Mycobacterium sp. 050134]|uniref:hypothetical protein n=1 Tax=Mycobacterium sp. 050134 TaxID=3096111 RepID=UPI002EDB1E11
MGGAESSHVGAGLGDHHVGGESADAGDGADQVAETAKGFHHHLDSVGERLDGRGVLVDQVQMHPSQKRVMGTEPTVESFCELRDFPPQLFLGEIGHGRRIGFARLDLLFSLAWSVFWGTNPVSSSGGVSAEGADRLGRSGGAGRAQESWPGGDRGPCWFGAYRC